MFKNIDGIDVEMTEDEINDFLSFQSSSQEQMPAAYIQQRQGSYPTIADQMGSVVKCLKDLQSRGIDLGSDGETLVAVIDQVKKDFPKS